MGGKKKKREKFSVESEKCCAKVNLSVKKIDLRFVTMLQFDIMLKDGDLQNLSKEDLNMCFTAH